MPLHPFPIQYTERQPDSEKVSSHSITFNVFFMVLKHTFMYPEMKLSNQGLPAILIWSMCIIPKIIEMQRKADKWNLFSHFSFNFLIQEYIFSLLQLSIYMCTEKASISAAVFLTIAAGHWWSQLQTACFWDVLFASIPGISLIIYIKMKYNK